MPVLAAVSMLAGLLIAAVGFLGLRERLPRNRFLGVRTSASLRDVDTFRLANRVAGLPTLVGGLAAVLGGLAAVLAPGTGARVVCLVIGLAGMVAITTGAGVLGHRTALAVPEPTPANCGSCACGNCPLSSASR